MSEALGTTNRILITPDIDSTLENLLSEFHGHRHVVYKKDEFLIADSKEAIAEAYLTSDTLKTLILAAKKFNTYSQNALLKVLEEPPRNVAFLLISESRTSFLPTIRSRLPVKILKAKKEREAFPLELDRLELADVYGFLKDNAWMKKEEALDFVENLLIACHRHAIALTEKDLELFSKSVRLLTLNERPQSILTMLLLTILKRRKR